jgi:hypothetical protein
MWKYITLIGLFGITACTGDLHESVETVSVNGREITVRRSVAEENTWSAFHSNFSDRTTNIGGEYFQRHLEAIRQVSRCEIRNNSAIHTGPTTIALVDC